MRAGDFVGAKIYRKPTEDKRTKKDGTPRSPKKLGKIHFPVFTPGGTRVVGFMVRQSDIAGMIERPDRFVALDAIGVYEGAIAVDDVKDTYDAAAAKRLDINLDDCIIWVGMDVRTESGDVVGYCSDVEFKPRSGIVQAFYVTAGAASSVLVGDTQVPPTMLRGYENGAMIVSDEVKRLSRMVRSMLNIAKIEAGEMKLKPTVFDVNEVVLSSIFTFEQMIEKKHLDIRGLEEGKVMVEADEDLIHQVVYNLLENAVKFVNEGGYIEVSYTVEQKRTYIHIKNSGEGIPKEEISKVFDRFYKTDRSRSMDKTGVGLGLYIVRQIVNLHQGEVIVRSVEGEYCEFSFSVATAPKALTKQPKPVDVREV